MQQEIKKVAVNSIYIVGTFDTKSQELLFVRDLLLNKSLNVLTVDLSTTGTRDDRANISAHDVANMHPQGTKAVFTDDRGTAVAAMAVAFAEFLSAQTNLSGIIGFGGSGGTALISPAMQALDIGIPKIIVSTMASGNIAPYVGTSDICMIYSVTDISGLNPILEKILSNAAHALYGMTLNDYIPEKSSKPVIGMTMFGVTTTCVEAVKTQLEKDRNCLVFHATGTGGKTLEKLCDGGHLEGVLDITTTEVADHLMGGVLSAGEDRLGAFIRHAIPYVGSCGALDMVNFGAPDTIPEKYKDRLFYEHNPHVTLMRTTDLENAQMGEWVGKKLKKFKSPVRFLIPMKGFSTLDAPGQAFYNEEADAAFIQSLEKTVGDNVTVIKLPYHINDPEFSAALAENYLELTKEK